MKTICKSVLYRLNQVILNDSSSQYTSASQLQLWRYVLTLFLNELSFIIGMLDGAPGFYSFLFPPEIIFDRALIIN